MPKRIVAMLIVPVVAASSAAAGSFEDGVAAYDRGDYPRRRPTTIVFRTSARIHGMLSREFAELNGELLARLKEVANKFILERVSANHTDRASNPKGPPAAT